MYLTRSVKRNSPEYIEEAKKEKQRKEELAKPKPFVKYTGKIIFSSNFNEIAATCDELISEAEKYEDLFVLGFDLEWSFSFQTGPDKTALMQICPVNNDQIVYLFHIREFTKLPAVLVSLLSHTNVRLAGVNIRNDIHKLWRDFGGFDKERMLENCVDSRTQAKSTTTLTGWSMEKLVDYFLLKQVNKDKKVRMSKWHLNPLSKEQKLYAATDAYISLHLYLHLLKLDAEVKELENKEPENKEMNRLVRYWNVGRIDYKNALRLQKYMADLHHNGANTESQDTLLLVEHPPVYTIGIRTKDYTEHDEERLKALGAEFHRTNRGGLITFHGPGQLVVYPILNLKNFTPSVRWYVDRIEETIIELCGRLRLRASTSPHTGVWIGDNKICAIGIHASRFVTTHGLALNCNTDLQWYQHIVPCGIVGKGVTSLTQELQAEFGVPEAEKLFLDAFSQVFNCGIRKYPQEQTDCIVQSLSLRNS